MESVLGIVVPALVSESLCILMNQVRIPVEVEAVPNFQTPSLRGGCCVCARFWS